MKITELRITNYRGIEALSTKVPAPGLIVKGPNGVGKTSILNAIRAALAGQDIGPDAVRIGTDRCEILVNMDDVSVRRVITAKGTKLTVEGGDAKPVKAPQTWLNDLLGTAPLDPIELYSAKPPKQKAQILAALPLRVSADQVDGWLDGWKLDKAPDYTLHGLEVVDLIRKEFYTKRADANAEAKAIEKGIEALEAGAPAAIAGALPVPEAEAKHRDASAALAELQARTRRAAEQVEKTKATRERAAKLRVDAAELEAKPAPDPQDLEALEAEVSAVAKSVAAWRERIAELEKQLAGAREGLQLEIAEEAAAVQRAREQRDRVTAHTARLVQARQAREQADSLEAAIASTSETAPDETEIAAAAAAERVAAEAHVAAHAAKLRADHEERVAAERTRLTAAHEKAGQLTGMVDKFTKVVPNELLHAANGIPGLALDGDDVFLDDVRLSKLSGREALLFAVEIARRLNVQAKILIVDELEKVDADMLPDFVAAATAGGYQLLATRVEAGEVVLEAIEPEETEAK